MTDDAGSSGTASPGRRQGGARRSRPAAGTQPADTKGGLLERRVARLEFAEGAFSRLRVPVPAEEADSGRNVLTDIDVLSIDVDLRLRVSRSSLECKSGGGQSGEPQTIVWLAGFRSLLGLDRVVYVRPAVSTRSRALARRLDIAVLDEHMMAGREAAHRWLPDRFAHLDGDACSTAEARTDTQLKGLPDIPVALAQFLRSEALLADSPALLAAVESLGSAAHRQGVLPEPAGTVLGSHALVAVILAALQDASRLDALSERELRTRLERALTTGDPNDDHLLPLLERADALFRHVVDRTHRAYVEAGAEPIRLPLPSLREAVAAPPEYLDDYLDLVTRLRANPVVARDLLQTAELACFEALLGGDAWTASAFAHLFTAEHLGLLLVALRCLGRIAGPHVAQAVGGLNDLRSQAGEGRVPDRRSPQTHEQQPEGSAGPRGPAAQAVDRAREVERMADAGRAVERMADSGRAVERMADAGRAVERMADSGRAVERMADAGRAVERMADSGRAVERMADSGRAVERMADAGRAVEKMPDARDPEGRTEKRREESHVDDDSGEQSGDTGQLEL